MADVSIDGICTVCKAVYLQKALVWHHASNSVYAIGEMRRDRFSKALGNGLLYTWGWYAQQHGSPPLPP